MNLDVVLLVAAFVYFPIVVLTLFAYAKRIKVMRFICKPLLMPALAVLYALAANKPNLWIFLALGFGWIGDVFLLGRHHWNQLGGIASFALGHIAYITGMMLTKPGLRLVGLISVAWVAICLLVARRFLLPRMPKRLRLPGTIYCALLSCTCASALYLAIVTGEAAYVLCACGGLLFIISDGLLAYDMFGKKTTLGNTFVMVTYILAQTALVTGFVIHGGI
ncbi:MAG: lysoplasmalogenase [Clostridia bacterium]|nr:lysoplasmalogenase [Clostridia bacterium]